MAYTQENEAEIVRAAQAGCEKAKNRLIAKHDRMISKFALKYGKRLEFEDARQIGIIGLLEALPKFDPDRGFWFNTYCQYYIAERIRVANSQTYPVKVSQNYNPAFEASMIIAASDKLTKRGDEVTNAGLAATIGVSEGRLVEMTRRAQLVSDANYSNTDDTFDLAADQGDVEEQIQLASARKFLRQVTTDLSDREKRILETRTAANDEPATLERLSAEFGVSRERVRQIEVRMIDKLQKRFAALGLPSQLGTSRLVA